MARAPRAAAAPTSAEKVHVPQKDGQIVFGTGIPGEERTFQVTDHVVSPRNADEARQLLSLVDGARLATAKESGESPDSGNADGTPAGDGK